MIKRIKEWVVLVPFIINILWIGGIQAQSPTLLRGDQAYRLYDRLEAKGLIEKPIFSSVGNYHRKDLFDIIKNISLDAEMSTIDRQDIRHFIADNLEFIEGSKDGKLGDVNEKNNNDTTLFKASFPIVDKTKNDIFDKETYDRTPIWRYFYQTKANFFDVNEDNFKLIVNPIVHINYGQESDNEFPVFQNTRGIDLRGYIDGKVYFFTQILENQRSFLSYIDNNIRRFRAIPGQGFYKGYQSGVWDMLKGYDYFNAKAYIGVQATKSIQIEFGHGNNFIGQGIRSLLLSDFSHNYLHLKINTHIWKFRYQNIFAELNPVSFSPTRGDDLLTKKYMATHYLAFAPHSKLELGLFETVLFAREDRFDFQYLNPVILYRAVEHFIGSPDNVILGLNAKWIPLKNTVLYGQFIMDEFKLNEVRAQSGWWANKFGWQAGIKLFDIGGISHFDFQCEYNAVRPFTYSHRDSLDYATDFSIANYGHYSQPLAHPLGSNFKEINVILRYRPHHKWFVQGRYLWSIHGLDPVGQNYGGNIFKPHNSRTLEFGNKIGQGIKSTINAYHVDMSYEFRHNYFVELQAMYRTSDVAGNTQNIVYWGLGFRCNVVTAPIDY